MLRQNNGLAAGILILTGGLRQVYEGPDDAEKRQLCDRDHFDFRCPHIGFFLHCRPVQALSVMLSGVSSIYLNQNTILDAGVEYGIF